MSEQRPQLDQAKVDSAHRQVDRLFGALDWEALAEIYCDEGGDAFWAVRRGPARRQGIAWGLGAARWLKPGGASFWVGPGVAELGPLVCEVLVLDRRVRAVNRRQRECEVLDAALSKVGLADRLRFEPGDAAEAARAATATFDHLGLVSVLTDPETFPELSGVGYGRIHPVHIDPERLVRERDAARALAAACLGVLRVPGTVTTSVEEVAWVMEWAERRGGLAIDASEEVFESAVVGDPVGFLAVKEISA